MDTDDPFDLARFVAAQSGGTHERALDELRSGRKRSHWMWFVFPQLRGLGRSDMAVRYGIDGLAEARAYLAHPTLGPQLHACAAALDALPSDATAEGIFGGIDAVKLRSSLTLFAQASGAGSIFGRLLQRYCDGRPDDLTLERLRSGGGGSR